MGRAPKRTLEGQHNLLAAEQFTSQLLNAVPSLLAILNRQRQIVFANRSLLDLLGNPELGAILGRRPGELLNCRHVQEARWECGEGEACMTCGTALALLGAQNGRADVQECRMIRSVNGRPEALDLEVWATPLQIQGEILTVLALTDISHSKHRNTMEKLFFHDVLNVIGTIRGFSELLQKYDPQDRQEIYSLIHQACQQVIDQVQAHRTLAAAEKRELVVKLEPLMSNKFLSGFVEIYRHHDLAAGRNLVLDLPEEDILFLSDRILLGRILGNLALNALEAVGKGETVTVGCERFEKRKIRFWVHNPGKLEEAVKHQVFQRSFSTKGVGRGLGTYSVMLLSSYLNGKTQVSSSADSGICFSVTLPISFGDRG